MRCGRSGQVRDSVNGNLAQLRQIAVIGSEIIAIRTDSDIVQARHLVRRWSNQIQLSLIDQTKLVTASSELARNAMVYGGGGTLTIELVETSLRKGLKLTFEDKGPGIADVELAIRDGFTTGSGLGLGLGGAKRLVDEFYIDTKIGEGTRVTVYKWKQ